MIELIADLPDNVVAVNCTGRVTRSDYERTLIPAVEAILERHMRARLYYRVGAEFERIDAGAVLEDLRVGFSHLSRWERVAIVTNLEWMRVAVRAFAFLLPCPVKIFDLGKEVQARAWIREQ